MNFQVPADDPVGPLGAPAETRRVQGCLTDPQTSLQVGEIALDQGDDVFGRRDPTSWAIEIDGPAFTKCLLGPTRGTEDRVTDPEGPGLRRMVCTMEEALVMTASDVGPKTYAVGAAPCQQGVHVSNRSTLAAESRRSKGARVNVPGLCATLRENTARLKMEHQR